jgi:hypothetical protein
MAPFKYNFDKHLLKKYMQHHESQPQIKVYQSALFEYRIIAQGLQDIYKCFGHA